ncbi:phage major capsid protein [Mycobacterium sp. 852014-52144_SCH5372336]|uniref:phage major capsid protein n=1 Tax=Mycobacterium sp. 852014-52144_SCH5372336 TaxID=1834115 RepID=UPI000800E98E|nr:phage major capsid protein [Mycobacterium sp. 852014-52144_SCH5372336]OBB76809.1 capsid protein [Mycobacterium sp. 852014-52144_SCH5372336]
MTLLGSNAAGILKPEEVHDLIVQPTQEASVAMQTATVIPTSTREFRFPVITDDVAAGWYDEGEDINLTDPEVDAVVAVPKALKSLTKVSRELAEDSSPEATALVGQSVARDIARKVDQAWFAASTAKGPAGLRSLIGTAGAVVGGNYANSDPFAEAISAIEQTGSTPTAFVGSAGTVLSLSKLKKATDSNEPLLSPNLATGATQRIERQMLGVRLWTVPDTVLDEDEVWAYDRSKVFVVLRKDVDLQVDPSFFFGSDSLAVRCVMRVDFAFPHPQSVVRIGPDGS